MKRLSILRLCATVGAFVFLIGGYAAHQVHVYMRFTDDADALARWTERISTPNLIAGWVFLALAVLFALLPDRDEEASA